MAADDPGMLVIGAMLKSRPALAVAATEAKAEWFAWDHHRAAFEAAVAMYENGVDVDAVSLAHHLAAHPKFAEMFGTDTKCGMVLAEAVGACEFPAHVRTYAAHLRHQATAQRWRDVAKEIAGLARVEPNADALDEQVVSMVLRSLPGTDGVRTGITSRAGGKAFREGYGADRGPAVPFPFEELNRGKGGYRGGEVVVLGGYTGDGKTWVALQALESACRRGVRAAYFSMEMTESQLRARLVAQAGHSLSGVESESVPLEALEPRLAELDAWPFVVYEGATTVERIKAEVRRAQVEGDPFGVVIVDHLHLMHIPGRGGDYRINLNNALTELKTLANGTKTPLFLLAQLNRPDRSGKVKFPPPTLASLRESTAIEQIADYVMFIYRHRDADDPERRMPSGLLGIAKQRQGNPPPVIDVRFDPHQLRFVTANVVKGRAYA